jgi:molybdopterin/thiamine biosynthesis adenylyltransferase
MIERDLHLRGLGFYNPDDQAHDSVTFVGVGGIGSFAAYGAAKLGIPTIRLIDPDEVEAHNYGNQLFSEDDIGERKVYAVANIVGHSHFDNCIPERADRNTALSGYVVSGLDSMEARAEIWEGIKFNPAVPYYIDARIGGQIIVVYALNPMDYDAVEKYEATLHSDDEGVEAPCTERGVIDVGMMVGAVITNHLRRRLTGNHVDSVTYVNMETLVTTKGEWM